MGIFSVTKMTFKDKKQEKGDIYTYRFTPEKKLNHTAGQHGLLSVAGSRKMKPFSISSSPDDELVEITTHARKESAYKQALHALKPGDEAKLRGPILSFTFKGAQKEVVMVAMGVGITPFRSMLRYAKANNLDHNITLIHSDGDNPTFGDELSKLADSSMFPKTKEAFAENLNQTIKDKPEATFYISGSPSFIGEMKNTLKQHGISKKRVKIDKFMGY